MEGLCQPGKPGANVPISAESVRGYSGRSTRHCDPSRGPLSDLDIDQQVSFIPVSEERYVEVRLVVVHLMFVADDTLTFQIEQEFNAGLRYRTEAETWPFHI